MHVAPLAKLLTGRQVGGEGLVPAGRVQRDARVVGECDDSVGPDESALSQRRQEGSVERAADSLAVGFGGNVHAGFDGPLVGNALAVGGSVGIAQNRTVRIHGHPKRETPGDVRQAFRKVVQRGNFGLEGR